MKAPAAVGRQTGWLLRLELARRWGPTALTGKQATKITMGLRERSEPGPNGPTKAPAVGVRPHGTNAVNALANPARRHALASRLGLQRGQV